MSSLATRDVHLFLRAGEGELASDLAAFLLAEKESVSFETFDRSVVVDIFEPPPFVERQSCPSLESTKVFVSCSRRIEFSVSYSTRGTTALNISW